VQHTAADRAARLAARRERRAAVTDPDTVMAAGAALLASRPLSVADMRDKLRGQGYPAALVDTVVGRLVELGYLDDARYAAAWVASRDRSRPRGTSALRRELSRKGIEPTIIEGALADREATPSADMGDDAPGRPGADLAAALRLLERRRSALEREPDPRKRRQQAYALLARNGFDPDVCTQAMGALARFAGDTDQD
jgi:regulatory protein